MVLNRKHRLVDLRLLPSTCLSHCAGITTMFKMGLYNIRGPRGVDDDGSKAVSLADSHVVVGQ